MSYYEFTLCRPIVIMVGERGVYHLKRNSREEMIKSTAYLLQIKSYVGKSINDIIEYSGSLRGSLYYHYPKGKEQLALEVVLRTKENLTAFITD